RGSLDKVMSWALEQLERCPAKDAEPNASTVDLPAAPPVQQHRPESRSQKEDRAIVLLLKIGPNVSKIAQQVGVKRTTLLGWRRVRECLEKAKAQAEFNRRGTRRGHLNADGQPDAASWDE